MAETSLPTEEEVLGYAETCSNWGRWGAEDQLGTLNLVTDEKRRQAAGLVRDGVSVSLRLDNQDGYAGGAHVPGAALHGGDGGGRCGRHVVGGLPGDGVSRQLHHPRGRAVSRVHRREDVQRLPIHTGEQREWGGGGVDHAAFSGGGDEGGVARDIARLRGEDRIETPVAITPEMFGGGGGVGGGPGRVGGTF